MNRPRSSQAREFLPRTVCLPALLFLSLLFAQIPEALGQIVLFQTPGVKAMQSQRPVNSQLQKRVLPGGIARPPSNLPTHESGDQPQDRDNPRINLPPPERLLFVSVPNLVGHPKDDALKLIHRAHLKLGSIHETESAEPVD